MIKGIKFASAPARDQDRALDFYTTKLGLKVVDERVTIDHDPMDPALGVVPYNERDRGPNSPVKWIDHGVLTALWDSRDSALETRNENLPAANSFSFRMSGGATSVEEMIQTTKRGLLVTRFSNTRVLDGASVLELMKLGATGGRVVSLQATGPDAQRAVDAVAEVVEAGFGEA